MTDWTRYYVRRAMYGKQIVNLRREYLAQLGDGSREPWIADRPKYIKWLMDTYGIDLTDEKIGFPNRRAFMMFLLRFG